MVYLLFGLLALIAVLLGIAVVRTLAIKAPPIVPCTTVITEEECAIAIKKLGAMVRFPLFPKMRTRI